MLDALYGASLVMSVNPCFRTVDEYRALPLSDPTPPKAPRILRHAIGRIAAVQPDYPAIVSSGLPPLSYRALHGHLDEVRSQLRLGGFSHSARIGVLLPNGPHAVLAIVAVAC